MPVQQPELNPASIAARDAERTFVDPEAFVPQELGDDTLLRLEDTAAQLGFIHAPYKLRVRRAVSAPKFPDEAKTSFIYNFFALEFTGKFASYSKARFTVAEQTLQLGGLCLNFYETSLLPDGDSLPRGHSLYVPVMSVEAIEPISL
jgi:hypothetical protein